MKNTMRPKGQSAQLTLLTPQYDEIVLTDDVRKAYGSYFTPGYVASALYERTFPDLGERDCVLDPTAGLGHLLGAVPKQVGAIGVEIQPELAARARQATGRPVVTGDIRTYDIERACDELCDGRRVTACFANPPFSIGIIEAILERAYHLLPQGGRFASILPVHFFHIASRTVRHNRQWSIACELLPRDVFPRLAQSICWAVFERDTKRVLGGFALYEDIAAARALADRYRRTLRDVAVEPWRVVVLDALRDLGGQAHLSDVYRVVESKRSNAGRFYREKVRQQLQRYAVRIGKGEYRLPDQPNAAYAA
jgi:site-specific DNA-methyltransferase (adenine-specific)